MKPTSVFVGGVGDDIYREDLEREFSRYGKLNNIWIAQNPPGFAFIEYDDDEDANDAIKEMNGAVINGSRIRVEISRNSGRRGGGGRGDRRGGRGRGFSGGRDGGFRGRGGGGSYGMCRRGGYDLYGYYNRYSSGGGRMGSSRYGSDDQYDSPSYGGMGGSDSKGSSYRSRSPIRQRNYKTLANGSSSKKKTSSTKNAKSGEKITVRKTEKKKPSCGANGNGDDEDDEQEKEEQTCKDLRKKKKDGKTAKKKTSMKEKSFAVLAKTPLLNFPLIEGSCKETRTDICGESIQEPFSGALKTKNTTVETQTEGTILGYGLRQIKTSKRSTATQVYEKESNSEEEKTVDTVASCSSKPSRLSGRSKPKLVKHGFSKINELYLCSFCSLKMPMTLGRMQEHIKSYKHRCNVLHTMDDGYPIGFFCDCNFNCIKEENILLHISKCKNV